MKSFVTVYYRRAFDFSPYFFGNDCRSVFAAYNKKEFFAAPAAAASLFKSKKNGGIGDGFENNISALVTVFIVYLLKVVDIKNDCGKTAYIFGDFKSEFSYSVSVVKSGKIVVAIEITEFLF